MSIDVEFSIADYHNIMNWYELAFAKKSPSDISNTDHATLRKVTVMADAYVHIQKVMKGDNEKQS